FQSGSTYVHSRNGGTIPIVVWQAGSMCQVAGVTTTAPAGLNQTFQHFEWNCPNQSSFIFLNGNLNSIAGDLIVSNTGAASAFLGLSSQSGGETNSINIGGDLQIINSARLYLTPTGNYTVDVGGDLVLSSDVATFATFALLFTGTGTATVNVAGDFIQSDGTLSLSASSGSGHL